MPYTTQHFLVSATVAVLATGLSTVTAQAGADQAACAWTVQELPAVAGFSQAFSYGTDHASHVFGAVSDNSDLTETPVVWSSDASTPPHVLGSAHGSPTTIAALNAAGVAVGYYHDDTGRHPIRYLNGAYEDLPVPPGASQAEAVDVNAAGDIVGNIDGSIILWPADKPGTYTVLAKSVGDEAVASGIDNARDVIGYVAHNSQITSYVWNSAGKPVALPPTAGDTWASANSIRNGRVVGTGQGAQGAVVVWDLSGRVLWHLAPNYGATSINADGLVSGWKGVPDGAVQRLMRNGRVVATPPADKGFSATGGPSAITDGGVLAGTSHGHVATARCH